MPEANFRVANYAPSKLPLHAEQRQDHKDEQRRYGRGSELRLRRAAAADLGEHDRDAMGLKLR